MGTDTPIAVLSDRPRLLFDYFTQLFAQVTNPPLDAIREELVTSPRRHDRPRGQPARPDARRPAARSCCRSRCSTTTSWPRSATSTATATCPASSPTSSRGLYDVDGGGERAGRAARRDLRARSVRGDRRRRPRHRALRPGLPTAELAPIPSLLLTGAVHHHLVREKTRTQVGLVVEAGDVREVHHVALLIGYGAAAVNPYLAMESVEDLARDGYYVKVEPEKAVAQPDQGARQGRAQGDVQDGHLDGRLLHRRADLRGASACPRSSSTSTSPARPPSSAASGST